MKCRLSILALLLLTELAAGQSVVGVQEQLDDLKGKIRLLEKENQLLRSATRSSDSLKYARARLQVFEAYDNMASLDHEYRHTLEKIALTGLFTKLMQANNPTSDILGFRFIDIIYAAAEKHFVSTLKNEPDKKRFLLILSKIMENPVIGAVTGSNPVTAVAGAIISAVVNFSTVSANFQHDGGKVRDLTINQQDAFSSKSITAFREELQVFITFYDELIAASGRYLEGLSIMEDDLEYLNHQLNDLNRKFRETVPEYGPNQLARLAACLPEPGTPGLDYGKLLGQEFLGGAMELAGDYQQVQESVNRLKLSYNQLLDAFLQDYIKALRSVSLFPEGTISKEKTGELIREIESFLYEARNS